MKILVKKEIVSKMLDKEIKELQDFRNNHPDWPRQDYYLGYYNALEHVQRALWELPEYKPEHNENVKNDRLRIAENVMLKIIDADTRDGIYPDPDEVCDMTMLYTDELLKRIND